MFFESHLFNIRFSQEKLPLRRLFFLSRLCFINSELTPIHSAPSNWVIAASSWASSSISTNHASDRFHGLW